MMHGPSNSTVEYAIAYGRVGWPIFPLHHIEAGRCSCGKADCNSPGKHPRMKGGFKLASTDEATIRQSWTRWPSANIGLATGHVSGLVVLDCDGEKGVAKLAEQTTKYGPLPPTLQAETGRGMHYCFALPPGVSVPSVSYSNGLDVRGDNGYVVVDPSMHVSGKRYRWVEGHTIPAAMPDWIASYAHEGSVSAGITPSSSPPPRATIGDRILNEQYSPEPWSEAAEARTRSMLAFIPAESYDDWLDIGMALHSTGWGEPALRMFDDYSRKCPEKYKDADIRKKWKSFGRPTNKKPITLGTLVHMAKERGWTDTTAPALYTDLGNARRLVARHGRDIRFVYEWHTWIIWDGTQPRRRRRDHAAGKGDCRSLVH
jgi:hypothetical protein